MAQELQFLLTLILFHFFSISFVLGAISSSSSSSVEVVISCATSTTTANRNGTVMTPFPVSSNSTYHLNDCQSNLLVIDFVPNCSNLENVTILVTGGTVLPRFLSSNTSLISLRNIVIVVEGVNASGVFNTTMDDQSPCTMLELSSNVYAASNVSVTFRESSLRLHVTAGDQVSARVSPLMLVELGSASPSSTFLSEFFVLVENSTISINVSISGNVASLTRNVITMLLIGPTQGGTMERIKIAIVNSTFATILNVSKPTAGEYQYLEASMFSIKSESSSSIVLRDVLFSASNLSCFTIHSLLPRNSSDTIAVVRIGTQVQDLISGIVATLQNITAFVENRCGGGGDCDLIESSFLRARVMEVGGIATVSNISNVTFTVMGCSLQLDSPKSALALAVTSNAALHALSVRVSDCKIQISSSGMNAGQTSRTQSLLEISSTDNATHVAVTLHHVAIMFSQDSGDCLIALSSVVGVLDNISFVTIEVMNVAVMSRTIGGAAATVSGFLATVTMGTSVVNMIMQKPAFVNPGINTSITIANTTLDVFHATTVSSTSPFMLIVSYAAIVNLVRIMTDLRIVVMNSHVVRSNDSNITSSLVVPPGSPASSPKNGAHFNVTAVVNLFDATTAILNVNPTLSTYAGYMYNLTGGTPAVIVHNDASTNVTQNCSLTYDIEPDASNCVALVVLPGVSNNSRYRIENTFPLSSTRAVGAVVGAIGRTRLVNSVVNASHVHGVGMLMFAAFNPTTLEGPNTSLLFDDVVLYYQNYNIRTQQYAIGVENGDANSTVISAVLPSSSLPQPFLVTINHCQFYGFTDLLMPNAFDFLNGQMLLAPYVRPKLINLGCSVWNSVGLPGAAVTNDSTLLPFIHYTHSAFNNSLACRGFRSETISPSFSEVVVDPAPPPPAVPPSAVSAVTSVAGVIGAAAAAMIDAQSLIALGRSVCAPQALHEATSASQFLLSPFYSLGDYAMVFGNLGLFLLIHGMHRFQLYRRNKTFQRTTTTLYHNNPPPVAKQIILHYNMHDLNREVPSDAVASSPLTVTFPLATATTIMRPAVALKFPNHSISVAMLLAPGVVNGGMRGLFSGEVVGTIGGVVGLVAVSLGVWWWWRSGNLREVKLMRFVPWPHHLRRSFIAPWLLPYGQWGPLSLRSTHGRLRGAVRVGCEWLSAQTITVALLVQAVASIPVPTSWCVGLWFVLCGVQLISVMLIVVVRPACAPATDVLQVISLLITATLELIAGLIASHATAIESESPLTVLSLASMVMSVVKSAHTALIFVWEMQQNNQQQQVIGDGAMEGDDGTIGNITSSNRKGARLLPRQDLRDSPPMVSPRESAWSSQLPSLFLLSPIEEDDDDDDDDDDGLEESSSWRSRMKSGTTPAQLLEELIGAVCALHLEAKKETKVSRWE